MSFFRFEEWYRTALRAALEMPGEEGREGGDAGRERERERVRRQVGVDRGVVVVGGRVWSCRREGWRSMEGGWGGQKADGWVVGLAILFHPRKRGGAAECGESRKRERWCPNKEPLSI